MAKQRHNIETIAEILVDKLGNMEKVAKEIDSTAKSFAGSSVKVDASEMYDQLKLLKQVNQEHIKQQDAFLSDLTNSYKKNYSRVPNWVYIVLVVLFLGSTLSIYYAWTKAEDYTLHKEKAEYFESKYNLLLEQVQDTIQ